MADHGDDVAEMLMNRTFNPYNARSIISYIYGLSKKRNEAKAENVLSEDMGQNTVDYNTDYFDLKQLDGFEAEKLSSFEFAALKAYVVNHNYGIECTQVKDCLLYKSTDFAKIKNVATQNDILEQVRGLYSDKYKVRDIVVSAKIADQRVEQELFSKLPYRNENLTPEQNKAAVKQEIKEEVRRDKDVTIKKYVIANNATTKERVTARAKSASQAKATTPKHKAHGKQVGQHLSK